MSSGRRTIVRQSSSARPLRGVPYSLHGTPPAAGVLTARDRAPCKLVRQRRLGKAGHSRQIGKIRGRQQLTPSTANRAPFRSCSRSVVRDTDVTRAIRERAPIDGGSGPKLPGIGTGSRHCIRQDLPRFGLLHSHRRSRLDTNCLEEAVGFASAWPRRPPFAAAPRPVLFPRGPAAPSRPGTTDESGDRIKDS